MAYVDFEALSALDTISERMDEIQGVDINPMRQAKIQLLPVHNYTLSEKTQCSSTCSVCLESYVEGESLKTLPCMHVFHTTCIDRWLMQRPVCPVCKSAAL